MLIQQSVNPMYRAARKLMHQYFGDSMIDKAHVPILEAEATQLVRDFMDDPDHFHEHALRYSNSFIMSTSMFSANVIIM